MSAGGIGKNRICAILGRKRVMMKRHEFVHDVIESMVKFDQDRSQLEKADSKRYPSEMSRHDWESVLLHYWRTHHD
jgi:hypothetical protein